MASKKQRPLGEAIIDIQGSDLASLILPQAHYRITRVDFSSENYAQIEALFIPNYAVGPQDTVVVTVEAKKLLKLMATHVSGKRPQPSAMKPKAPKVKPQEDKKPGTGKGDTAKKEVKKTRRSRHPITNELVSSEEYKRVKAHMKTQPASWVVQQKTLFDNGLPIWPNQAKKK